ncbi:MAG: DMT family transporter [Pseudomonadota bacterium]
MTASTISQPDHGAHNNGRAIAAILLAMFGFITNDVVVKLLTEQMPLPSVIVYRGLIACVLLAVLTWAFGQMRPVPTRGRGMIGLRCVGEIGATVFYLTALTLMPIANATAILQAIPLIMVACAAVILGERVGWRRWSAVIIGFVGMLLVIQPGADGFDQTAIVALLALSFLTIRDLSTRFIPSTIPSLMVTLISMIAVTIAGIVWAGITGELVIPTGRQLAMMAAAALLLSIGFWGITVGMRLGQLATVAPFRYSIILWAILLGYLVWGDVPDLARLLGIVMIVGSGLFVMYRERVRDQQSKSH